jgi:predicted SAM-dependent methyltransferase
MTQHPTIDGGICLNYGAAWDAPEDWLNIDASPVLRFERMPLLGRLYTKNAERFPANVEYGDVVKGVKLADDSVDLAFSSHVLEHLAREDSEKAVRETFRVLKPSGFFRLVVPDLEIAARRYIADLDAGVSDANDRLLRKILMGGERRSRALGSLLRGMFSNAAHQWMWDEASLRALLARHGFVDIRRAAFGDSADPRFHSVERENRFREAVALEARKPAV